jgi:hypothetical protein
MLIVVTTVVHIFLHLIAVAVTRTVTEPLQ